MLLGCWGLNFSNPGYLTWSSHLGLRRSKDALKSCISQVPNTIDLATVKWTWDLSDRSKWGNHTLSSRNLELGLRNTGLTFSRCLEPQIMLPQELWASMYKKQQREGRLHAGGSRSAGRTQSMRFQGEAEKTLGFCFQPSIKPQCTTALECLAHPRFLTINLPSA